MFTTDRITGTLLDFQDQHFIIQSIYL